MTATPCFARLVYLIAFPLMPFKKARANVRRKALPTLKKKNQNFFFTLFTTLSHITIHLRDIQVDYKKRKEKTRKTTTYTN